MGGKCTIFTLFSKSISKKLVYNRSKHCTF
jgi:hypothetical protein